jgi:hypothetical protein
MVTGLVDNKELTFFKRLISKFKHGLVLNSIRNQLVRIGIVITPYYWVQEGLNPTEMPEIKGSISDYTVGFLEAEDLIKIGEDIRTYSLDGMLAYLKAGKKCLGLKYKDDIASFTFIDLKECKILSINTPLKNDEAYLTHMYTLESFRGRNLAPYLRFRSYDILKEMGRNKIYSVSVFFNSAAIRYKQKLNAKNIKLILYVEFFKKLKWSFTLKTY